LEQIKTPESSLTLRRRRLLLVIAKAISINCYSLGYKKLAVGMVCGVMLEVACVACRKSMMHNVIEKWKCHPMFEVKTDIKNL